MRNDNTKFVAIFVLVMICIVGFFAFGQTSPNEVEDKITTSNVTKVSLTIDDFKDAVGASSYDKPSGEIEENVEEQISVTIINDINTTFYDMKTVKDAEKQYEKLSKYQDKFKSQVEIHEKVNNGIIFGCKLRNDRYKYTIQIADIVIDLEFGAQNISRGVGIVKKLWNK